MAYKIILNNAAHSVFDDFTIKEELNETLDSGIIKFPVYGEELSAVPFDRVKIYDDENKISEKVLLVNSYDEETLTYGNASENLDRIYTMTLFSETKRLERITLPNLSITKRASGSQPSVWDKIQQYCNLYIPKVKVLDRANNQIIYKPIFTLDSGLQSKFSGIECPEMQWNKPTLREVLNDLMSTKDCIVRVQNGVIGYYDISKKGSPIDTTLLSTTKRSINADDYVGELTIDMHNAIGKNVTTICEYKTLRCTEESGEITTDNAAITTARPIYNIKSLIFYMFDKNHKLHKADMTDHVLEQAEWSVLPNVRVGSTAYYNLPTFTDRNGLTRWKHRVAYIHYKRGGNSIEGIGTRYKTTVSNVTQNFANLVFYYTFEDCFETASHSDFDDLRNIMVKLEYESISEHAMHVGHYLPIKHPENRIFDNQSNSYVDIEHQSIFEYAKVNRLGNKITEIYGEYQNEDDIPELGDYIDDKILFSREIRYLDSILYFHGYLTPNYILRDFFTGVQAKKRSWQIASEEEALTRHDVWKYYVEFSFQSKTDIIENLDQEDAEEILIKQLTSGLSGHEANKNIKFAVTQTRNTSYPRFPGNLYGIIQDSNFEVQGMSLCFNTGFSDNFKSDDYVTVYDNDSSFVRNLYQYANENGEFTRMDVALVSYIDPNTLEGNTAMPTPVEDGGSAISSADEGILMNVCYEKPKMRLSKLINPLLFTYNFNKDNREIIQTTIQFEYCSDTPDIVVTKRFIELCGLYNSSAVYKSTHMVFMSANATYTLYSKYSKGNQVANATIGVAEAGEHSMAFSIGNLGNGARKSIGITDSDGNLLIGINTTDTSSTILFYANLLVSRDDKVYFDGDSDLDFGNIHKTIGQLNTAYFSSFNIAQPSFSIHPGVNVANIEIVTMPTNHTIDFAFIESIKDASNDSSVAFTNQYAVINRQTKTIKIYFTYSGSTINANITARYRLVPLD